MKCAGVPPLHILWIKIRMIVRFKFRYLVDRIHWYGHIEFYLEPDLE